MNILITAGPTREYIDAVRFLSNASSGRMGYALAEAAREAGHQVTLISGPVALQAPHDITLIPVTSADDMYEAVHQEIELNTMFISAAAVADYRPKSVQPGKMKKEHTELSLDLVQTRDILLSIGRHYAGKMFIIGFALETTNGLHFAREKMRNKHLNAIVLNAPDALQARTNQVQLVTPNGTVKEIGPESKHIIARTLIHEFEQLKQ